MGCERKFKKETLEKHEKICQKVFLEKRKVFDSANQRHLEEEVKMSIKPKQTSKVSTQANNQITSKPKNEPKEAEKGGDKGAMPKWKLQSLQLRSGLKRATQKELTKEEAQFEQMEKDTLVPCNYCGRRFAEKTAERHIPFCQQQAKKLVSKTNPLQSTKKKW